MTPKPAYYEIRQRPVWDPAPGTEHIWACLKTSSLAMHRLSDRVLGVLTIAIDEGIILPNQCNLNESDLAAGFQIRRTRSDLNLGRGLLTPDGRGVVAISAKPGEWKNFALRGNHPANVDLPVVPYNKQVFQATDPNYLEWRNQLIYKCSATGTPIVVSHAEFPKDASATVPADWPAGLTRDRDLASEKSYRVRKRECSLPNSFYTVRLTSAIVNSRTGKPIAVRPACRVAAPAAVAGPSSTAPLAAAPSIVATAPAPKSAPILEDASAKLPSGKSLSFFSILPLPSSIPLRFLWLMSWPWANK